LWEWVFKPLLKRALLNSRIPHYFVFGNSGLQNLRSDHPPLKNIFEHQGNNPPKCCLQSASFNRRDGIAWLFANN